MGSSRGAFLAISRVRSVTETIMMFMMPMPPTSREIAAAEPRRMERVLASAGHRVGYDDASQFSREYKRLFGQPPAGRGAAARGGSFAFSSYRTPSSSTLKTSVALGGMTPPVPWAP